MRWKGLIITLFACMTVAAAAAGPKHRDALSHIKFGKCRIVSLVPTGLRSVRIGVELETKNDTLTFTLQDVKMDIFRKGASFVEGVCEEVTVPKGTSTIRLTGDFELAEEVTLWQAATVLRNADPSDFTANVDLNVLRDTGRKVAWSQKDINIGTLVGKKTDKKDDKKADTQVTPPDTPASTVTNPSDTPAPKKADQPKQTTKKKKRRWWQFWKR